MRPVVTRVLAFVAVAVMALPACQSTAPIDDPLAVLGSGDQTHSAYERAMETLDLEGSPSDAYIQALRQMLHRPGYDLRTRESALDRLLEIDRDAARRTLEVQMPRMSNLEWRRRLCERIADDDWTEMTPTLVRAWAYPIPGWVERDELRPERKALTRMYGADRLPDLLFDLFVESNAVTQQNLRTTAWEMLLKLGERDRLVALLAQAPAATDDAMLLDLRAAATDLNLLPQNREEILWVRALRTPERSAFWSAARAAVAALPPGRSDTLEVRDLAIVVETARTHPDRLAASDDALAASIMTYLDRDETGRTHQVDFRGWEGEFRQLFPQWRSRLKWNDLLAILVAIDVIQVPEVRGHLMDYGDRDIDERSTELGGIVRVDAAGRYEVVEFQPRIRGNDERFEAPPDMFEAGYTALFHFHFHATGYNNARYAGPAQGDFLYANATRVNALCFTFIERSRMNVDYYRHGGVSVDLGEIRRP